MARAKRADDLEQELERTRLQYGRKLGKALNDACVAQQQAEETVRKEQEGKLTTEEHEAALESARKQAALERSELLDKIAARDAAAAAAASDLQAMHDRHAHVEAALRKARAVQDDLKEELSQAREDGREKSAKVDELMRAIGGKNEALKAAELKTNEEANKARKLKDIVATLEKDVASMKSAAVDVETTYNSEIEHLKKLVHIHDEKAKHAERRATDCEEALEQERVLGKKERDLQLSRARVAGGSSKQEGDDGMAMDPHVKALLENTEKALAARWSVMQKQGEQLDKARAEDRRMKALLERANRQVKELRASGEAARRDAIRYSEQVDKQAERIEQLKKKHDDLVSQQLHADPQQMQNAPPRMSLPARNPADHPLITPRKSSGFVHPASTDTPVGFVPMHPAGRPSWPPRLSAAQEQGQDGMDVELFASPGTVDVDSQFASTLREMSEVRRRHERLLESLRDNRVSLG